jgi:hypothetical protein
LRLFPTEQEAIHNIINQVIKGKLACTKVEEKLLQYKQSIPAPQLLLF